MCRACREAVRARGQDPSCEGCRHAEPALLPGNRAAAWFVMEMLPLLFNKGGEINASGVQAGFKALNVPASARPGLFNKATAFAEAFRSALARDNG